MSKSREPAHRTPWDFIAIALSGLCIIHCLSLPLIILALPALGEFFESPLIHRILLACAIPMSLIAFARSHKKATRPVILIAIIGMIMLGIAAYYVELHEIEHPLSIVGASLIACAHFLNFRHNH